MGCLWHRIYIRKRKNDFTNFLISRFLEKKEDIFCGKQQLWICLYPPPECGSLLFSSHTQTWTHKPPIDCSYIWVYPLSISISINHSTHNCSPSTATHTHRQRHTHTHKHQNSDTLHRRRIDYQCGFYWRVWGADTSALGLLILLSYPNEPCVIHHCSAGSTQAAGWLEGLN